MRVTWNVALKAGSSKTGKGAAGVGGLELRDRIVAARGLRKIEAAQLTVQDSREINRSVAFPAGMVFANVNVACCLSGSRLADPFSAPPFMEMMPTIAISELNRIQRDCANGLLDVAVNHFRTGERRGFQIGRELKRIVRRNYVFDRRCARAA